jgi:hypothetical protein
MRRYEISFLEYTSIEAVGQNYATEKLGPPFQIMDEKLPIDQANYINIIRAKLGWSISKGKSIIDVTTIESGIYQQHKDLLGQIKKLFSR